MAHKAKALVISCIDFRFQKMIEDFIEIEQDCLNNYDHIATGGAALDMVNPTKEEFKEYLLKQVNISVSLHAPDTIYLINHEDCGAYGEAGTVERHTQDLYSAKDILQELYPDTLIRTYIATFEGVKEV